MENLSADRRGLWLLGNTAVKREEAVRGKRVQMAVLAWWWRKQKAGRQQGAAAKS